MSVAEYPAISRTSRYFNHWSVDATTTMLGGQADEFADPRSVETPPSGCVVYGVLVAVPFVAIQSQKSYWRAPSPIPERDLAASGCLIALEGTLDQVGFPGDAVASTSPWPELWSKPTLSPSHSRGLVVVDHLRQALFEADIQLDIATLPRWRPFIAEHRHTSEENNE